MKHLVLLPALDMNRGAGEVDGLGRFRVRLTLGNRSLCCTFSERAELKCSLTVKGPDAVVSSATCFFIMQGRCPRAL